MDETRFESNASFPREPELNGKALEAWVKVILKHDPVEALHARLVSRISRALGERLGLTARELESLRWGGLLHDVGKLTISDSILGKTEPLTDEEWDSVVRHPQMGYDLLAPLVHSQEVLQMVLCHHEHWDGSGYPKGLAGDRIPLFGRIAAAADIWAALRTERPYRRAWSEAEARAYLPVEAGRALEPTIAAVLLKLVEDNPAIDQP